MKVFACPVAAAVFCALSLPLAAQTPLRTLTIDAAVDEAIHRNLALLASRANITVAEAAIITARLRPNPVLSGGANSLDWLGTGFNDINAAGPPEYSIRVDVPFERGQKREFRMEVADQARRTAEAQFADAVRRLKLDVTLASVDVLEAKAKVALAQNNLEALERLLQLNERRLTAGAIPELEVSRSRVAMLQYRGNVRTAQLALTQARLKLLPLLGKTSIDEAIDIDDRLGLSPMPASPDVNALHVAARTARPDLMAARLEQARTQADLRLQLAQGKVDYTFGAEYRRQQGVNGTGNMLGLFFSVPLPVFNRNQGEIARSEAESGRASKSVAAVEADVDGDVTSAYADYESSRLLLTEIERDLLQPTNAARTGTTYMYEAGATSLLDVLDAQRAYNDTMDTYVSAQAGYRRAQARLALAVGKETLP